MTLMNCLILAFLLFGIGVWGLMRRRHLIGRLSCRCTVATRAWT